MSRELPPASPRRRLVGTLGLALAALILSPRVGAHVNSGASCQNCHGASRNGLNLTGFQLTTNLGAGTLKVFQVAPGQTLPIGIQVTDGHNEYGLALLNPDQGGVGNAGNKLLYQADTAWTKRTGYYSLGPKTANQSWTYRLGVQTGTPPDLYPVTLRMAGTGGGRWTDTEHFYVQVLHPTPPAPAMTNPSREGDTFSCEVLTVAGFGYFLEARRSLGEGAWTVVARSSGDGTTQRLTDSGATAATGLYRIRVE